VFFELEDYYHSLIIVQRVTKRRLDRPRPICPMTCGSLPIPGLLESITTYAGKYKQDLTLSPPLSGRRVSFVPTHCLPPGAGLMQVMPSTGEWIARQNNLSGYDRQKLYDADMAIHIGTGVYRSNS